MSAYESAVAVAAKAYNPRELALRNEAEGYAARRLATEYHDPLMMLVVDPLWAAEEIRQARRVLGELEHRIGTRRFTLVAEAFRDEHLIEGVDY